MEINQWQTHVHQIARDKGFYAQGQSQNAGEKIALIHSEISEALAALREPTLKMDDHCPDFFNLDIEMADAVIRIMDFCEWKGIDLQNAIYAKSAYNERRPYKHGKAF